MKKLRYCIFLPLLLLLSLSLSGCELSARAYPVSGPLVDSGKTVPLQVTFQYNFSGHGQIQFVFPYSKEICKGEYSTIANSDTATFFSQTDYTKYYGSVMSTYGMQYGQALASGDQGTIIQAEYFVSSSSLTHGYGLAKDNHGNIYKIMF